MRSNFRKNATGSPPIPCVTPQPVAPGGTVSVAAAIALTLFTARAEATVGAVRLEAGAVVIEARHHDLADSTATGAAADRGPPTVTIGAAIAITDADVVVSARTGSGTTVLADALSLVAGMDPSTATGDPATAHRFAATSIAGAGSGGTLGLAGALALATVSVTTTASAAGAIDLDRDADQLRYGGGLEYFIATQRGQAGYPLRAGAVHDAGQDATYISGGLGMATMKFGVDVGARRQIGSGDELVVTAGLRFYGPRMATDSPGAGF